MIKEEKVLFCEKCNAFVKPHLTNQGYVCKKCGSILEENSAKVLYIEKNIFFPVLVLFFLIALLGLIILFYSQKKHISLLEKELLNVNTHLYSNHSTLLKHETYVRRFNKELKDILIQIEALNNNMQALIENKNVPKKKSNKNLEMKNIYSEVSQELGVLKDVISALNTRIQELNKKFSEQFQKVYTRLSKLQNKPILHEIKNFSNIKKDTNNKKSNLTKKEHVIIPKKVKKPTNLEDKIFMEWQEIKKKDKFTRRAYIYKVWQKYNKDGIKTLINALSDEDLVVRNFAIVALRAITGKNFGYNPADTKLRRKKMIKLWKEWYKKWKKKK